MIGRYVCRWNKSVLRSVRKSEDKWRRRKIGVEDEQKI